MSVECQVNVKSQSELDIGGRETCKAWSPVYLQFSLVLCPRQCLSLIFESCPNVRNQEGISRTLMY